jgi:hypothetical protein
MRNPVNAFSVLTFAVGVFIFCATEACVIDLPEGGRDLTPIRAAFLIWVRTEYEC